MPPLTTARIQQLCSATLTDGAALEAAVSMRELAGWWLRPEVLARAAALAPSHAQAWQPRQPRPALGRCWLVLVGQQPAAFPLLRPVFLLPVRWRAGCDHAATLPPALRVVAAQVVAELPEDAGENRRWGLHLDLGDNIDLAGLTLTFGSAWAALAAGLLLARRQLYPDPTVWASGAWDPSTGSGAVEGLAAKLAFAGTQAVQHFFVPLVQRQEAEQWQQQHGASFQLGWLLPDAQRRPRQVLHAYLRQCGIPPTQQESFAIRKSYYELQERTSATTRYYQEQLLPDIVARLRVRRRADWPDWRPTHLVTFLSGSPDLIRLCAAALEVSHVLILHTTGDRPGDSGRQLAELQPQMTLCGIKVTVQSFEESTPAAMQRAFAPALHAFWHAVPPEQIVLDTTPGKKSMTLALAGLSLPGSSLVYIRHQQLADHRADPGTEELQRWPVPQAAALPQFNA